MGRLFGCKNAWLALPLFVVWSIYAGGQQAVAPAPVPATVTAAPGVNAGPTDPAAAKAARLRTKSAQLKQAIAQLQEAVKKAGSDKLSIDVLALSLQVRTLAYELERELETP